MELQGGTIEVNSKKGEGTEFIIRLKLKIAEEEDFSDKKQEKKGFEGKRLLLVEDNPLNQEVARTLLAEEGFVIECAGDGLEALEMVSGSVPGYYDLILMDIQMPRMDGYQASKEIRNLANPGLARIPIVALTANAFEEDKKEAFASGMDGHMAKPFDLEKAMSILEEILGRTGS